MRPYGCSLVSNKVLEFSNSSRQCQEYTERKDSAVRLAVITSVLVFVTGREFHAVIEARAVRLVQQLRGMVPGQYCIYLKRK